MHLTVKARRLVARHPWIYWVACLVVGAAIAVLVAGYVTRLDQARQSWGSTGRVMVATADLVAGERLQAKAIEMPVAVIPPGAIEPADMTAGAIVRQRVSTGEVLVATDLTAPNGPAALADNGTLVVGITDPLARDVQIGLSVQITSEGVVLAEHAHVVGLADEVILVAVEARAAPMVALAAHDGSASIVFVP